MGHHIELRRLRDYVKSGRRLSGEKLLWACALYVIMRVLRLVFYEAILFLSIKHTTYVRRWSVSSGEAVMLRHSRLFA